MACACCRRSSGIHDSGFLLPDGSRACVNVPESLSPPEATSSLCHSPVGATALWVPHLCVRELGTHRETGLKRKGLISL